MESLVGDSLTDNNKRKGDYIIMAGQVPNNNQPQPMQQAPAGMQLAYIPIVGAVSGSNIDAEIRGIIPSLDISMFETMLSFCTSRQQAINMGNKLLAQRTEQVKKLALLEAQYGKVNEFIATCQ